MDRLVVAAVISLVVVSSSTAEQEAAETFPEAIHWRQYVFSIPYNVHRDAKAPDAPVEVRLFVSADRGVSWQEVSRVPPNIKGFTYYAPADGEYWFALRTIDRRGNVWPPGPHQTGLRVVVDTAPPKLELKANVAPSGNVEMHWRVVDDHPRPSSLQIEARTDANAAWHPVELTKPFLTTSGGSTGTPLNAGKAAWQPPDIAKTVAFRATITDRAGNRTETVVDVSLAGRPERVAMLPHGGDMSGSGIAGVLSQQGNVGTVSQPVGQTNVFTPRSPVVMPKDRANADSRIASIRQDNEPEMWPADETTTVPPGELLTSKQNVQYAAPGAQRIAEVPGQSQQAIGSPYAPPRNNSYSQQPIEQPATSGAVSPQAASNPPIAPPLFKPPLPTNSGQTRLAKAPRAPIGPTWQTLPLTGCAVETLPAGHRNRTSPSMSAQTVGMTTRGSDISKMATQPNPNRTSLRNVNARSFSLEYEVESVGPWGVGQVELWGTTDGGATWRRFGVDADQRSPMTVMVDGEGEYGFRIVVQSAGSIGTDPPRPGDVPDLWVQVDLKPPTATIEAIRKGQGNLADHMTIRWVASDERLAGQPISLFHAAHPAGPWTTIATRLENTGQYMWRLIQHVPENLYFRIEARDTAGNIGSYSTAEPVRLVRPRPMGRIRDVRTAE